MHPRRTAPLLVLLLLLAGGVVLLLGDRSSADAEKPGHAVYLSIQGEGPTAKAWYRGAPPTGTAVQEALDVLSRDGYRVVTMSPSTRPVTTVVTGGSASTPTFPEQVWVVLLEKR